MAYFPETETLVPILAGGILGGIIDVAMEWITVTYWEYGKGLRIPIIDPLMLDDVIVMLICGAIFWFGKGPIKIVGLAALATVIAAEIAEFIRVYIMKVPP